MDQLIADIAAEAGVSMRRRPQGTGHHRQLPGEGGAAREGGGDAGQASRRAGAGRGIHRGGTGIMGVFNDLTSAGLGLAGVQQVAGMFVAYARTKVGRQRRGCGGPRDPRPQPVRLGCRCYSRRCRAIAGHGSTMTALAARGGFPTRPKQTGGGWLASGGARCDCVGATTASQLRRSFRRRRRTAPLARPPGGLADRPAANGDDADVIRARGADAVAGGADGIEIVFDGGVHPVVVAAARAAARRAGARACAGLPASDACLRIDAGDATPARWRPHSSRRASGRTPWSRYDPIAATRRQMRPATPTMAPGGSPELARSSTAGRHRGTSPSPTGGCGTPPVRSEAQELAAVLATVVWLPAASRSGRFLEPASLAAHRRRARRRRRPVPDHRQVPRCAPAPRPRGRNRGDGAPPLRIHAETAWRMMSAREPAHERAARPRPQRFAAAVGGAEPITVLPFDAALDAARRCSRPPRPQHPIDPRRGGQRLPRRRSRLRDRARSRR